MPNPTPRLYSDLAHWWPLMSPPSEYVEEAEDLLALIDRVATTAPQTALELGSGGGSLAFHLKSRFAMTLTDRSPQMLEVSRGVNPECEHVEGDMTMLRLGQTFDFVLMHDALMYLTTPAQVQAALATAAVHCRQGGIVVLLPDCVRETFEPGSDHGGEDGPDGRGLRYLEWSWDPDPRDDTFEVAYSFLLRDADGSVRSELDLHREGLFARDHWLSWLHTAGFEHAATQPDRFRRDVFSARR